MPNETDDDGDLSSPFHPKNLGVRDKQTAPVREVRVPSRRQTEGYVPKFPARLLPVIRRAKATKVLDVVLAVHRQLHMTKRTSTPLNGAIWDVVGSTSKRERTAIVRSLGTIPQVICLNVDPAYGSYYRVSRGSLWTAAESSDDRPTADSGA
jgi:hypothetical protein